MIDFTRNRVVLLTAESEAHTKPLRQPGFRDVIAIEFAVQEEVKYSIILFDYFESRVLDLVRVTAVRLKVEENQLVSVVGQVGVLVDGLKGA